MALEHGGELNTRLVAGVAILSLGVATAFAVDRLRDLARRSFLARLCLASGGEPLWPFEGSTAVDAALADDEKRRHWRDAWRSTLASITGSEQSADAASPGADPLRARA